MLATTIGPRDSHYGPVQFPTQFSFQFPFQFSFQFPFHFPSQLFAKLAIHTKCVWILSTEDRNMDSNNAQDSSLNL